MNGKYAINTIQKAVEESISRDGYYLDFDDVDNTTLHQINELLKWLRTKAKGSDVREVIAQLFERVVLEASRSGNANLEVAKARGIFGNLEGRLNSLESILSQVKQDSPQGVFDNIEALRLKYPTGTGGVFITKDDSHWWAWDGSKWFDGGKYQGAVIEREEIKLEHLSEEVRSLFTKIGIPLSIEKLNKLSNVELIEENGVVYKKDGKNYNLWEDVIKFGSNHVIFKAERHEYWLLLDDTPEGRRVLNIANANNSENGMNTQLSRLSPTKQVELLEAGSSQNVIKRTFNHFKKGDYIEIINKNNKIIINKKSPTDNDFVPLALIPHTASSLGLVAGISINEVGGRYFQLGLGESIKRTNVLLSELQSFEIDDVFNYFSNLKNEVKKENRLEEKYAVVLVAGQSNAVGYDESVANVLFEDGSHDRIFELGIYGNDNLKVKKLEYSAQNFQNMTSFSNPNSNPKIGTKGIHLPLGKLLAKELPDDYNILFVSCAFGGTGFTTNDSFGAYDAITMLPSQGALKWGVNSAYYKAMIDRVKYALELNPANIFLGAVWIQGEHDASNSTLHKTKFEEMTTDFFNKMNAFGLGNRVKKGLFDKDSWFNVESCAFWKNIAGYNQILDTYKNWNQNTYVEIPINTDTNAKNGTGLTTNNRTSHFGNNAYRTVIAPAVFEKMKSQNTLLSR